MCLPETKEHDTPEKLQSLQGLIDCQQPITDLYRFVGKITLYGERPPHVTKALQAQNVLLRGAKLKNTDYIYGEYCLSTFVYISISLANQVFMAYVSSV